jgi:hypothetical protein
MAAVTKRMQIGSNRAEKNMSLQEQERVKKNELKFKSDLQKIKLPSTHTHTTYTYRTSYIHQAENVVNNTVGKKKKSARKTSQTQPRPR